MITDEIQLTDRCHSERSEESMIIFACGPAAGFFATLRMTGTEINPCSSVQPVAKPYFHKSP